MEQTHTAKARRKTLSEMLRYQLGLEMRRNGWSIRTTAKMIGWGNYTTIHRFIRCKPVSQEFLDHLFDRYWLRAT